MMIWHAVCLKRIGCFDKSCKNVGENTRSALVGALVLEPDKVRGLRGGASSSAVSPDWGPEWMVASCELLPPIALLAC